MGSTPVNSYVAEEEKEQYIAEERNEVYNVWRPSSRVELSKSASAMVVSVKDGHNHGEGCDRVFAPETGK